MNPSLKVAPTTLILTYSFQFTVRPYSDWFPKLLQFSIKKDFVFLVTGKLDPYDLDLDSVKVNQRASHLGQRSFRSKSCCTDRLTTDRSVDH